MSRIAGKDVQFDFRRTGHNANVFTGEPFIIIGHLRMECCYGRVRKACKEKENGRVSDSEYTVCP
jgi:hypothetical protein